VIQTLDKIRPDEVYNLAGQTSVALSFEQPVETLESVAHGTLNLLEAIRFNGRATKLYNAGSSECFGDLAQGPPTRRRRSGRRSPYAVAKAAAFWEVANYREAYDLFACSGILFNHRIIAASGTLRSRRKVVAGGVSHRCRQQGEAAPRRLGVARD
jgi:GDPmannose 4,6-dehydratase